MGRSIPAFLLLLTASTFISAEAYGFGRSRATVCQAALMTLRADGHSLPSISREKTESALASLQMFRREVLGAESQDASPSDEEVLLVSEAANGSLRHVAASRILGIENHYTEGAAREGVEGVLTVASEFHGAAAIETYLTTLETQAVRVEGRLSSSRGLSRLISTFTSILGWEFIIGTALALPQDPAQAVTAFIGHIPFLLTLFPPDYLPRLLFNVLDFGRNERLVQQIRAQIQSPTPRSWLLSSRNFRLMKLVSKSLWRAGPDLLEKADDADESGSQTHYEVADFEEGVTYGGMLLRQVVWRVRYGNQQAHEGFKQYARGHIFFDHLLYVDEDREPHLVVVMRMSHEKPRGGRRKRAAAPEREDVRESGLLPVPARRSAIE